MSLTHRTFYLAGLIGLTTATLVGAVTYAYGYYRNRTERLRYSVPGAWQHPSAVPGSWDQAVVVAPDLKRGRYVYAVFQEGADFVNTLGKTFGAREINHLLDLCITEQGYQPLAPEYWENYGL